MNNVSIIKFSELKWSQCWPTFLDYNFLGTLNGYGNQRKKYDPVFHTSNSDYGWQPPNAHTVPHRYEILSNTFDQQKNGPYLLKFHFYQVLPAFERIFWSASEKRDVSQLFIEHRYGQVSRLISSNSSYLTTSVR